MARYIKDCDCAKVISEKFNIPLGDVIDIVYDIPTADVVEVVRCKDCKHWKKYENTAGAGYCKKREFSFEYGNEHTFNPITMPDFNCSYGERRYT